AESQRPEIRFVVRYGIGSRRGRAGPGIFVRYLGHGGRVSPNAPQNERRLISPLTRRQHAPARQVPRARGAVSHDRPDAGSPWNASGRDISVLFLEQPEPGVHIAVGHLEQARRAAAALVNDAVALRQREDVVLVPSDGVVHDLTFAP